MLYTGFLKTGTRMCNDWKKHRLNVNTLASNIIQWEISVTISTSDTVHDLIFVRVKNVNYDIEKLLDSIFILKTVRS